jgi:hypothetical protein
MAGGIDEADEGDLSLPLLADNVDVDVRQA